MATPAPPPLPRPNGGGWSRRRLAPPEARTSSAAAASPLLRYTSAASKSGGDANDTVFVLLPHRQPYKLPVRHGTRTKDELFGIVGSFNMWRISVATFVDNYLQRRLLATFPADPCDLAKTPAQR
eukprot:6193788-Pleurochrysis_carterae.AAC.1